MQCSKKNFSLYNVTTTFYTIQTPLAALHKYHKTFPITKTNITMRTLLNMVLSFIFVMITNCCCCLNILQYPIKALDLFYFLINATLRTVVQVAWHVGLLHHWLYASISDLLAIIIPLITFFPFAP